VEQLFLEELNDARANPAAYGASIGLDLSGVAPAPPLAFDPRLIQAARLHSLDMNNRAFFGHTNPDGLDPGARLTNAGYPWYTWAESIGSGAPLAQPADALRALIIDSGVPDLGHRKQLLAMGAVYAIQTQVGIGIVQNGSGPYLHYYTIDTAATYDGRPFLSGVIYNDANHNGRYDLGEGLGGVTITVAGVGSTTTWDSGGYSLQLSPGSYVVTASGGGLGAPVTVLVTVGGVNVRLNFTTGQAGQSELRSWVKLLYRDLLHRTAGAAEIDWWVANLVQGMSRDAVVAGMLASAEYNQGLVSQLYRQYLHRAPDPQGLAAFVGALQNGASEADVRQALLSSPEYANLHGGTAAGFVRALYHDLLGRSFSGHEADYWINLAQAGDRGSCVAGILGSPEFLRATVRQAYRAYFRRDADEGGLDYFVGYLQAGGSRHFALEQLLTSDEYLIGSLTW
jgi:hypothetical protein